MSIDTTSGDFDRTYLSLGAGVQSTALYVASVLGLHGVPRSDLAVFADTGDEPAWVYEQLDGLREWAQERGGPEIQVAQKGVLSEWMTERQEAGKRFVSVPLYTASPDGGREGMLRRQCTREFKIEPIEKAVRSWLGYKPRQRIRERVRCLLGITIDEATRMKPSRTKWVTNSYPLVDAELNREDCKRIVMDAGLPEPKKSSCVYCPYHSDAFWRLLRDEHPKEFARAVRFDEAIRDMTMAGRTQPGYVHRSCLPLAEAPLDGDENQGDLFGEECEGMCGL